ncbi:MAG TPA: hypothetical protein VGS11_11105 [Candidatus Bathyarchaeia archaeon]|nr:hypothetical protein [Candidatus Bathyarchaeia archaeon]
MPVERDEVGPKIDYPGLTYAPINEQGVVLLFGMMSDDLGFSIEAIRQGFPDALVVDYRANPNRGVKKSIEFEFTSSHFARQKHPVKGAQIIVCWEHDWKNVPKEIEVLELKSLIQKLKREEAEQSEIEEMISPKARVKVPLSVTSDYSTAIGFSMPKRGKEKPAYETSWNARLEWIEPDTRSLAERLIQRLEKDIPGTQHRPRFRWHSFYFREPFVRKNEFATVLVGRKTVRLSIRVSPKKLFADPFGGLFKPMAGFFYPRGEERRAFVTPENLEAVISVARSAYHGLE